MHVHVKWQYVQGSVAVSTHQAEDTRGYEGTTRRETAHARCHLFN